VTVEERNVEIDGMPIRYLTAGDGPPLMLLHGADDNALEWHWVMPALAATHQVFAPECSPKYTRRRLRALPV
jgi:pimeloyl-ACP methyl ester carboxylesterase